MNGCCLTVTENQDGRLSFDLLAETLQRTNLGALPPGAPVNLERALSAHARLGGHFVQGHVDASCPILSFEKVGADYRLEITLPTTPPRTVKAIRGWSPEADPGATPEITAVALIAAAATIFLGIFPSPLFDVVKDVGTSLASLL